MKNILEKLEELANSIINVFRKVPKNIKKYAEIAFKITKKVKEALESDTATTITNLIPGTWDDKLKEEAIKLTEGLQKVFQEIADMDVDPKVKQKAQEGILHKMSSSLIAIQDGKELPTNRYDWYAQTCYSKLKTDNNLETTED